MIDELRIRGLGVIDDAHLEFSPGFTVLTGETGAGKTMVLTSLRMLMGEKVDSSAVRSGCDRAEVDAVFTLVAPLIADIEFDGDELIIWRTLPAHGRTRAAINARPVPLRLLTEIVGGLVTIHGQSDQWLMRREEAQRTMVDSFAGHDKLLAAYVDAWKKAVAAKRHRDQVVESFDKVQAEVQYLQTMVDAIAKLELAADEENFLNTQIDRLSNANRLRDDIGGVVSSLDRDGGVTDTLGNALGILRRIERLDASISDYAGRLEAIIADAQELVRDLTDYGESLLDDPQELERLSQRRAQLEELLKGRGQTVSELLAWESAARDRLVELTDAGMSPDEAEKRLQEAQQRVLTAGERLHHSREKAAKRLTTAVNKELSGLAMKEATFSINVTAVRPASHGCDEITMELRPHPHAPSRPLGEGASGGELSRVMLALEVALGSQTRATTYIFDEVDAGIGGRTALEVGNRLRSLSRTQQVIVVTHLPQIAAMADKHMVVAKKSGTARVWEVAGEARIDELVRMLGGETTSLAARRHASELLGLAESQE
ncbi:DNA repair protein RecN [Actinomycetaceae bacterium WB03_NA08]|uniref:DNA repair protein RecN n=1 Tax=Scrofimicrobium canadense TaxID=2652290 RepID=A0A6N7W727_9ACTO|nr:DNA repair protein RecN [Scrofimicrobium canadense]MSS83958.1 DNA repair protein RecN [Scrofimicrobium canadense]